MAIDFNPSISFKAEQVIPEQPENKPAEASAQVVASEQKSDEFVKQQPKEELSVVTENKKETKDLTPAEYAKIYIKDKAQSNPEAYKLAKGVANGAAVTAGFLGMSWFFNALPKVSKKGPKFMDVLKHPLKHMDRSCKFISFGMGALMLGYTLLSEKLKEKAGLINN